MLCNVIIQLIKFGRESIIMKNITADIKMSYKFKINNEVAGTVRERVQANASRQLFQYGHYI